MKLILTQHSFTKVNKKVYGYVALYVELAPNVRKRVILENYIEKQLVHCYARDNGFIIGESDSPIEEYSIEI